MTDGGLSNDHDPAHQASWPPPPAADWGSSPTTPPGPREPTAVAPPGRPRRIAEVAVVIVLTAAIVALAFTVVGGHPRESAEPNFREVGSSIDSYDSGSSSDNSSGEWNTVPMEEEDGFAATGDLFAALPNDDDVEDLLGTGNRQVLLQKEEFIDPGPVKAFCTDVTVDAVDGALRGWTTSGGVVEVDARIYEMASVADAREAVTSRQTDAFLACIPDDVASSIEQMTMSGGEITDASTEDTGDQLEQVLLIERGSEGAILAWRQVDHYVVSLKVFEADYEGGASLDLAVAEDLLAIPTDSLGG
jgi:hypothetical protein